LITGTKGQRIYLKGAGFAEALNETHNGRNFGSRVLAVFIGIAGIQGIAPALPPAHW
jgi:hypothetical protein